MRKIEFLYNPNAGNRRIRGAVDTVVSKFQQAGFKVSIYRSMSKGDMSDYIKKYINNDNTDLLVISGGDGSVNEVVSAMMEEELKIGRAHV